MTSRIPRITAAIALATGTALFLPGPAFAGQAYPAPGFPSANASCVGTGLDFQAHYGGDSFPTITHGTVGPNVSGHATNDGPGAVGAFNSALAQNHGWIMECLP
ncbi:MAG: hypothetical protein QOH80_375 [Actinomycetota bacterium]|jgi:hypothetical protein|nr:hypothetical protein [Actinomycetota bacterium]